VHLPRAARVYLYLVASAAIGGLATWMWAGPVEANVVVLGELIVLAAAAQHFPLSVASKRKFDISIAVHFAIVDLAPGPLAMALVGAGEAIGQLTLVLRRDARTGQRMRGLYAALFNSSQYMLAAGLAAAVVGRLPRPADVLVAALVLYFANSALVASMVALHQGKNPLSVWRVGRGWSVLQAAGLLTLGFITAETSRHDPWVPVLMVLPAAMTYVSMKRTEVAEAGARAREEFLSIATHELRTPLTSLWGFAQVLTTSLGSSADPPDKERTRQVLRNIDKQCRRLRYLIDQLLDLSRLDAGRLELDREMVDLAAIARDVAAALEPAVKPYRLVVRAAHPSYAMVDRLRIEQVLTNLITNAAKHAGGGELIEVQVTKSAGGAIRLTVRDYGKGIAPDRRKHVFERYYRAADGSRARGLGIGLYLTRQIVERHGGEIGVDCPAGGGATFHVCLPTGLEAVPRTGRSVWTSSRQAAPSPS
jgi:signal transduction histidine kinase